MPDKLDLDRAYALETPDDSRALYADWAKTYDSDFAESMDYRLPQIVAEILAEFSPQGPVLDVGAGTGLVGQYLSRGSSTEIHALDISPQMLAVAMGKGVYARSIEADLTQELALPEAMYGAVVSSGTFTHGHVGPDAIDKFVGRGQGRRAICAGCECRAFRGAGICGEIFGAEGSY